MSIATALSHFSDSPHGLHRMDHEVVEMQLLLPRWQIAALEETAIANNMTTGQMLRRVISGLVAEPTDGL